MDYADCVSYAGRQLYRCCAGCVGCCKVAIPFLRARVWHNRSLTAEIDGACDDARLKDRQKQSVTPKTERHPGEVGTSLTA